MRTIFVNPDTHKCYVTNDGTMTPVETDAFDGMCDTYVEGHCYENRENSTAIYPWKPYSELDAAQRLYEQALIAEYAAALQTVGVTV
jgi:hypothetical protein